MNRTAIINAIIEKETEGLQSLGYDAEDLYAAKQHLETLSETELNQLLQTYND
jgi:hypothetical protein